MLLKHSENTAIKFLNQEISYSELLAKIGLFSELFKANKGDRILVFAENKPEWIYAFYAIWEYKAIPVPVDYLSSPKELQYILEDCKPSAVFYSKESEKTLLETLKNTKENPQIINIDNFENKPAEVGKKTIEEHHEEDTGVIIYTSGTTGSPKGVMLSFKNIQANIDAVSKGINIFDANQTTMVLLPLHHVFPLMGSCIAPLSLGGIIAMSPSLASNDIMETLQKHKVTIILGVPRLYSAIRKGIMDKINHNFFARNLFRLAKTVNSPRFSKTIFKTVHKKFGGAVRFLVSGGAALNKDVASDFKALGFDLLEGFGMTEAAPMITFTRPGKLKVGSAGQAVPNTELKIKDGEILSRGPHIMQGYYQKPEETAKVIKDGWLHTGDLGSIDKKGRLFVTGRKKEIIVLSNGKNINPTEIEFQLEKAMPYVKELAVFEKDDALQLIIVPDAVLVKQQGIEDIEKHTLSTVLDAYNQSVSAYKKIYHLHVYDDELPKTRLSKIQRFKLADLVYTKTPKEKSVSSYTSTEYELIKQHIEDEKGIVAQPDDHIEFDLGLDSLEKVSLQVFIESTFGVNIKAEKISEHDNLQKLSEFVKKMKTKIQVEKINWSDIIKEKVNLKFHNSHLTFWFIIKSLKLFFRGYLRYNIKGKENIPEVPCIITPNHQSYLDGMLVASAFKSKILRKSYFFAKAKHIKTKIVRYLAKRNNIIIVDVNEDLRESIQSLATAIEKGKNVIIFPEGTRSFSDKMGEFKKTFAILSKELGVPVVPVAIKGANKVLPRGKHFPKPFKKVTIEFLKPINPSEHTYDTLTETTRKTIEQHLEAAG